jgi:Amino acid permease
MIGFSTVLGVGLFLSAGKAIFLAGPGGAVLAYLVTGTIVWSVMACMGEMTALFPVKGPVFEFPRRFIDESVGLATGWIIWCVPRPPSSLADRTGSRGSPLLRLRSSPSPASSSSSTSRPTSPRLAIRAPLWSGPPD